MGTLGEICADMDTNLMSTHVFGKEPQVFDINTLKTDLSGHGGGDFRMIDDLLNLFSGGGSSLTSIDKSIESHLACFAAEYSRTHGGINVPLREAGRLYKG